VGRPEASALGIMHIDSERRISQFVEKPKDPALLDTLRLDRTSYPKMGITEERELFLASMGIYVFKRDVVVELLNNTLTDFGSTSSRTRSRRTGFFRMSIRVTGRTSGRSGRFRGEPGRDFGAAAVQFL